MTQFAQHALDKAVRLARVVPRSMPLALPAPVRLAPVPIVATPVASKPVDAWVNRQRQIAASGLKERDWLIVASDAVPVRPRIEDIQIACAKHYHVSRSEIISARRTANIVLPRQVGYYLSKMLTLRSLPEIGRRFGGRDHTSALSGIRKIERLRKVDAALELDLQTIATSVGGSLAKAS